jgi:hypothetical protein
VSDTCACCRRPWDVCFPEAERRELREFVCHECKPHQGFTMQSDPEHIKLWRALLAGRRREHARMTADLKAQMADLEERLRNGPRTIGLYQIQAAQEEAQRAFRSRENAWQALCEVRLLHREAADGRCRCGARFDRCAEAQIVDRYPALVKWENEQYDRLRRGLIHALPDGHPAVLNPRWRPD